ncbi:DEKNAAC104556 [Brettanomyces naardenensis]|uniref:intramembrane prenyl-peptidase Rce1 n=1 Tax=Brettanomyces naardenensis TaxID=13370 RepID=A0A448YRH5_BRENA|nr:DEKNAAC104556 [Brettanomyces naardenensis]
MNLLLAPIIMKHAIGTADTYSQSFKYLGIPLHFHTALDLFRTLLLFSGLFLGPIIDNALLRDEDSQEEEEEEDEGWMSIYRFRDLIFAPVTEEIIFTSISTGLFIPLIEEDPSIEEKVVALTPLLFGVSHLHHGVELLKQGHALAPVLITIIFQLIYTTFFGILTNLIFLNSRSIWCCIAAHSFCNFFGVPAFRIETNNPLRRYGYWALLVFGIWFFRTRFNDMTMRMDTST